MERQINVNFSSIVQTVCCCTWDSRGHRSTILVQQRDIRTGILLPEAVYLHWRPSCQTFFRRDRKTAAVFWNKSCEQRIKQSSALWQYIHRSSSRQPGERRAPICGVRSNWEKKTSYWLAPSFVLKNKKTRWEMLNGFMIHFLNAPNLPRSENNWLLVGLERSIFSTRRCVITFSDCKVKILGEKNSTVAPMISHLAWNDH